MCVCVCVCSCVRMLVTSFFFFLLDLRFVLLCPWHLSWSVYNTLEKGDHAKGAVFTRACSQNTWDEVIVKYTMIVTTPMAWMNNVMCNVSNGIRPQRKEVVSIYAHLGSTWHPHDIGPEKEIDDMRGKINKVKVVLKKKKKKRYEKNILCEKKRSIVI